MKVVDTNTGRPMNIMKAVDNKGIHEDSDFHEWELSNLNE